MYFDSVALCCDLMKNNNHRNQIYEHKIKNIILIFIFDLLELQVVD